MLIATLTAEKILSMAEDQETIHILNLLIVMQHKGLLSNTFQAFTWQKCQQL